MYRRMYGTQTAPILRSLGPLGNGPWLRAKPAVSLTLGVILGCVGFLFVTLVVGDMGLIPAAPNPLGGILLLLCAIAGVVALTSIVALVFALLCPPVYQYCPDCLSYMTRGAKVCPFCGFR
jgi:hypothetical protein